MKKLFAISFTLFVFTLTVFAGVHENMVSSFNKAFPLAQNVKWNEDTEGYFVTFTQSGILSRIAYDQQGDFVFALRYYKEENLPTSVLLAVRKKFADKIIFGITEVSTVHNITYHLILEDEKYWYSIAATPSGNITLEERHKKVN